MSAPNTPKQPDPVLTHSLSWPLAITALLLMASTLWAMYDEFFGKRPWADYQNQYIAVYAKYLDAISPERATAEGKIAAREDYKTLAEALKVETAAHQKEIDDLQTKLTKEVQPRIDDLTKGMIEPRSEITATIYLIEVSEGATKQQYIEQRKTLESRDIKVAVHDATGKLGEETFKFTALGQALEAAKKQKSEILAAQARAREGAAAIEAKMKAIESLYRTGLSTQEISSIKNGLENFNVEIKQIHVTDIDLVDRCESCHVGIRQPVPGMTPDALKKLAAATETQAIVFAAHPKERAELLKIHDPERFGCSPCHGGNGVGTSSVELAHGKNHHWLWPMYDKVNTEAGCVQCHQSELRLEGGNTISAGKELFRHLGCWGCHPRDGFQPQRDGLQNTTQSLKNLLDLRDRLAHSIQVNKARKDEDETTPAEAKVLVEKNIQITLQLSSLKAEEEALRTEQIGYATEFKKVGPNLKNVRAKLNPEWVAAWLKDNKAFRPTTRMPQFRFTEDQRQAVGAFIWQSANATMAPKAAPGDADLGEELFHSRGCLACHGIQSGDDHIGATFASDLSRIGEKANYDYLVHWVSHPDRRLTPFNITENRDCTPEEAALLAPNDPAWHQSVIMPNLRLSATDAQNIASYLVTLKKEDATYAPAPFMTDEKLFAEGKKWVKHFGCAGCHEIGGLENEGTIGTDLTKEGSKPIEQLDFGMLTHDAENGHTFDGDDYPSNGKNWYNHKGFIQRKLKRPEVFDVGKEKLPEEKLRMPNFNLPEEEITQLTTFLLGSVASPYPARFRYEPQGYAKDIAEGWWIVQKYNCNGCHQIVPGERPLIQKLEQFDINQGGDIGLAPPNLVGEGARVNPEWLARFLRNPAQSTDPAKLHRNGVRPYLQVRMPTFSMSEREIQTLVRFFNALSKQPEPYIRPQYAALTDAERLIARESVKMACVRCHASGDDLVFPASVIAPNLGFAGDRLKPTWIDRWVVKPSEIFPGTNMPDGLFTYNTAEKRWIMVQKTPGMDGYKGDQRELVLRYLLELNPEEAKLLKAAP